MALFHDLRRLFITSSKHQQMNKNAPPKDIHLKMRRTDSYLTNVSKTDCPSAGSAECQSAVESYSRNRSRCPKRKSVAEFNRRIDLSI